MNVFVATFTNPFSFFCVNEKFKDNVDDLENTPEDKNSVIKKSEVTDLNHGQYIVVMWNNKWTRGIVSMESQFLIWLVDYGKFIRPSERTIYRDLPFEYKKYPTKVFEASLHGVIPVDKGLSEDCLINNKITTTWNPGSVERAQQLIRSASKVQFFPIALLSTKHNDVVLGDLILEIPRQGTVNIINELERWPVFLEKNKQAYIDSMSVLYTTRRRHRGCLLKPEFPGINLATLTLETAAEKYPVVAANSQKISTYIDFSDSDDNTTVSEVKTQVKNDFKITAADVQKYSERYINIHGRTFNVLNVLVNKARDLRICEQYKDLKSVGRGWNRRDLDNNN